MVWVMIILGDSWFKWWMSNVKGNYFVGFLWKIFSKSIAN